MYVCCLKVHGAAGRSVEEVKRWPRYVDAGAFEMN